MEQENNTPQHVEVVQEEKQPELAVVTPVYQSTLTKSFSWMAIGLFVSFVVSIIVALSPSLTGLVLGSRFGFMIMILAEFAYVWYLSRHIMSLSVARAKAVFIGYAVLSGLTLSVIFFAFETSSIISIFIGTAVMFAVLAIFGARTKRDLSSIGQVAYFALIGLVVASLVNLFLHNSMLDMILAWVGVAVFTVLITRDTQKIKEFARDIHTDEDIARVGIIGALTLYLDFINLFLSLLRIFGGRRK